MATNDIAARIAAILNPAPTTSQINWPLLWGNLTPMGQTPEGYVVARQPGGDVMLADPNSYSGKTNNLLDLGSYLATGGQSGWSKDGFMNSAPSGQALAPYQVGIDANNGSIYDYGNGLVTANGATPFNAQNGGSINPTAPLSAHTDGNIMGSQFDAAKMKELGYQQMTFGQGGDSSTGWVKNIGGRLIDPYGVEIDQATGLNAKTPYAYAGTPPAGTDFAWGANSDEQRNYLNRNAGTAYNYQPQQAQQAVNVPSLFGGATPQQGGLLGIAQQQSAPQAQQAPQQMPQQGLSMQNMNPFFSRYWGK